MSDLEMLHIQPRNTGKSGGITALMEYSVPADQPIDVLSSDVGVRQQGMERLKAVRDFLPDSLVNSFMRLPHDNAP